MVTSDTRSPSQGPSHGAGTSWNISQSFSVSEFGKSGLEWDRKGLVTTEKPPNMKKKIEKTVRKTTVSWEYLHAPDALYMEDLPTFGPLWGKCG